MNSERYTTIGMNVEIYGVWYAKTSLAELS